MLARHREITKKYKSFRLQHDSIYHSRIIQTLFNKFTKKGKKAFARRHILRALSRFRFTFRKPRTYRMLLRLLRNLYVQFILVAKRKGKKFLDVPFPVRRNKRDVLNIQTLFNAVTRRRERDLAERIEQEIKAIMVTPTQSATLRQRNLQMHKIYEERVNMEERWK
jgi:ribosomal protein S7